MEQDTRVDIKENHIKKLDNSLLSILLKDHSSGKNIIWATVTLIFKTKCSIMNSRIRRAVWQNQK